MNNPAQPASHRGLPILIAAGLVVILLGIVATAAGILLAPRPEQIAFKSKRDANYEIYIMNADGSGQKRLTFNDAEDGDAKISRGGQWIVFASNRDQKWEIFRMRSDGTEQTRLTDAPSADNMPEFSADGAHIAFVRNSTEPGIYTIKFDGSDPVRLTTNRNNNTAPT